MRWRATSSRGRPRVLGAAAFNYTGLNAEEMEERITSIYERSLTNTVNDIEHIESQSIDGRAIIKVFFQPTANVDSAVAQVGAISSGVLKQLPPGTTAPRRSGSVWRQLARSERRVRKLTPDC